jgi:predicted alpha/beta hydrolase family esterase
MPAIITLPGINGSGRGHWQTLWEKADPNFFRFQPPDWDRPALGPWITALDRAIAAADTPPVLVAHSLACLLVPHWAAIHEPSRIRGAFLVSVPDPQSPVFPKVEAPSFFAPVPSARLPFATLVIASSDDPYGSVDYARGMADKWGAGVIIAGAHGHMNSKSGLAVWPQGRMLLDAFKAGLRN